MAFLWPAQQRFLRTPKYSVSKIKAGYGILVPVSHVPSSYPSPHQALDDISFV